MAADILAGKAKPADMAIKAQDKFETIINKAEVEKLGLKLPADLEKLAK